jgi:transposase
VALDNGRLHTAQTSKIPDNLVLLFLPPYAPELNPPERFWRDRKDRVAQDMSTMLDELSDRVLTIITQYSREDIRSLTSYSYFVHAVHTYRQVS